MHLQFPTLNIHQKSTILLLDVFIGNNFIAFRSHFASMSFVDTSLSDTNLNKYDLIRKCGNDGSHSVLLKNLAIVYTNPCGKGSC
jgi:hypothetical protein